jgi:hypothetical protein
VQGEEDMAQNIQDVMTPNPFLVSTETPVGRGSNVRKRVTLPFCRSGSSVDRNACWLEHRFGPTNNPLMWEDLSARVIVE